MIAEKNVNVNERRQYALSEGWMIKKLLLFSYPFMQHQQYHLTKWERIEHSLTGTINVHCIIRGRGFGGLPGMFFGGIGGKGSLEWYRHADTSGQIVW